MHKIYVNEFITDTVVRSEAEGLHSLPFLSIYSKRTTSRL
jgi:hypothetical protein